MALRKTKQNYLLPPSFAKGGVGGGFSSKRVIRGFRVFHPAYNGDFWVTCPNAGSSTATNHGNPAPLWVLMEQSVFCSLQCFKKNRPRFAR